MYTLTYTHTRRTNRATEESNHYTRVYTTIFAISLKHLGTAQHPLSPRIVRRPLMGILAR